MSTVWRWPGSTLVRVVDGDSFTARLTRSLEATVAAQDLGFHGTVGPATLTIPVAFEQKLRLNRINAPKASSAAGKASTARATALMMDRLLLIETVAPYKYGDEWMAEVTLPDGGNVSDLLVAAAMAVYWDGTGPRPADGLAPA